ncbi:MAG: hypothetical protein MUE82_05375 [Chloroflexi bacterium]|jgi:hypothetical protein|nr:hypothetical protein [Chloroflexota bacterium]
MRASGCTAAVLAAIVVFAVTGCGGGASGDPTATVKELVSLVEAKEFSRIADISCAAEKQTVAEQFDIGTQLSGELPGMDAAAITDAMTVEIAPVAYKELEKSADKAKVQLTGTMTIGVDKEKMRALLVSALEGQDLPIDDAMIGPALDGMVAEFGEGQDIDSTVDLVYENGKWLICGATQGG